MEKEIWVRTASELAKSLIDKLVVYRKGRIKADENKIDGIPSNPWMYGYILGFCLSHALERNLSDGVGPNGVPNLIAYTHIMIYPTGDYDADKLEEIWNMYTNLQKEGDDYFNEGTLAANAEFKLDEFPALRQHCVEQNHHDSSDNLLSRLEKYRDESMNEGIQAVNITGFQAYKANENPHWLASMLMMTPVRFVADDALNDEIKKEMVDTFCSHPKWSSIA